MGYPSSSEGEFVRLIETNHPPPSYLTDYDCSIQFLSPQKRDGHPVSVAFGRDKSAL